MEITELNRHIGKKLKGLRMERELTLDQLAVLTGVSKPMLSQIERGETNPTVGTLWKIAVGLGIAFSALIEEPSCQVALVKAKESSVLSEDGGRFVVAPIFAADMKHPVEVFQVTLHPGCKWISEPHGAGVEEYITVAGGSLQLIVHDKPYLLEEGDSIRFQATARHHYLNPFTADCRLYMLITYFE